MSYAISEMLLVRNRWHKPILNNRVPKISHNGILKNEKKIDSYPSVWKCNNNLLILQQKNVM